MSAAWPGHWPPERAAQAESLLPMARLREGLLAPRPQFYGLRPAKDALAAALGEQALAEAWMAALGQTGPWQARWCMLQPLLAHAQAQGWPVTLFSAGRMVDVPRLPAVGAPDQPAGRYRCRSMALVRVPDAVVHSKSNLVRVGDVALLDHQDDELARVPCHLSTDGAVLAHRDGRVALPAREGLERLPQALSLLGLHSFAYGHWLEELFPKLWACLDVPGFEAVTVLVDAQMPAQHMASLALALGGLDRVRVLPPGQALQVDELWAVTSPLYYPIGPAPGGEDGVGWHVMDGAWLAACLHRLAGHWPSLPDSPHRRLYLSRADTQHRRLLNRPAVEAWFRDQGFAVLDCNGLSFPEQLALMRGAEWIVAPEGSALSNTLFARPGTRIGVLAGPQLAHHESYAQVTQALGQRLCLCLGRQPQALREGEYFGNYEIDLDLLPRLLQRLDDPAGAPA